MALIGDKIRLNGILWDIIGKRGDVYRLTHKCQRWELRPTQNGIEVVTRTTRVNTHRKLD